MSKKSQRNSGITTAKTFDIKKITFSDIKGTRVLVFDNTKNAKLALERVKETYEINHGFLAALDGHAEELSIDTLVKFYLANGM